MLPSRLSSLLPIAGIFALAAGGLGWLWFGFVGEQHGEPILAAEVAGRATASRPTVERWDDYGGPRTLGDVQRLPATAWRSSPEGNGHLWFDEPTAVWLRVHWRNPEGRAVHGVLALGDYFLDRAECWTDDGAGWRRESSGEKVAGAEKTIGGRDVAFAVDVPARGERVAYLRLENRFPIRLRPEWWPDATRFLLAQSRGLLAEGFYFGALLALLGYNLALWVRLRFADIGYYVLYLGSLLAFVVLARALPTLAGWPLGSPGIETVVAVATAGTGIFLIQFARVFLELGRHVPRGDRLARAWQGWLGLLAVGALSIPWTSYQRWMTCAAMSIAATHVVLPVLAIGAWRAGARQARFFLLAFGCLFLGTLVLVVRWFKTDATGDTGMIGLMIGSALELLLLSLAVADRFAHVQRRLVAETEEKRAIQEAYADELALEVRERTRELEDANQDKDRMLAVIGHDLRSPLTGLMKSADKTSGDFAREAAQTGRALLLMIEDLVLWARLRAGSRVVSTVPARALLAPAVALHRALAERGGTELVLAVPEELRVETDLVLAQTLVRNLLANALKFARTRVELRAENDGTDGVRFTVRNDGAPLPAAVIARLAAGENAPMTATGGLGLRLCREICTALETSLAASAPAEGGAEFGFTLRRADPLAEENS